MTRTYRADRAGRACGQQIPDGAEVSVVRFFPRRRALVEYQGRSYMTMLWCLRK